MAGNKFFIRQYSAGEYYHGGIGYADAETVLQQNNFEPIDFPHYNTFTVKAKLARFTYLVKLFLQIRRGATVVFIFPVFATMTRLLIRMIALKRQINIICFIADIDGIKDGDKVLLEKELRELSRYKYFIVHNEAMKNWLQIHVNAKAIVIIHFFDFLTQPFTGNRSKSKTIVFGGNLEKSKFLEHLFQLNVQSPGLQFNLYGPGITKAMLEQGNIQYKGILEPYKMPDHAEGSFGLLWDGDSIDQPAGSLGDYMQYITHHKVSLYILGSLPLIVPETAGSASLVRQYNIGVTIKSLQEINAAIESISAEVYQQMRRNMEPLAKMISTGGCLTKALNELEKMI